MFSKKILKLNSDSNLDDYLCQETEKEKIECTKKVDEKFSNIIRKVENLPLHSIEGEKEVISELLEIIKEFQNEVRELRHTSIEVHKDVENLKERVVKIEENLDKEHSELLKLKDNLTEKIREIETDTEANKKFIKGFKKLAFEWILKAIIVTAASTLIAAAIKFIFEM